jgi:ribosomal protein S18 acetylase RimI-like enzyme
MSTASVSVRPATAADRPAILALGPRLAEGVAPWRDQDAARTVGHDWLNGSLDEALKGTGAVFVAVDGGTIEGVISVNETRHFTGEQDGYIGELVVAVPAARRGIGRALIGAAETWAREHGLEHLTLHAGAHNANARAFYAALGFAEEEVRLTRPVRPTD